MVIGRDWEGIVLAAAQLEGGMTPRDDNTTGSEDANATGSRNREEEREEVEMLVAIGVADTVTRAMGPCMDARWVAPSPSFRRFVFPVFLASGRPLALVAHVAPESPACHQAIVRACW